MSADSDVVDVVTAMLHADVHSMPIVDRTRLVDILTRRDLVRASACNDQAIAAYVPVTSKMYGGADRWNVEVHDGHVLISGEFDDATDSNTVTMLAPCNTRRDWKTRRKRHRPCLVGT